MQQPGRRDLGLNDLVTREKTMCRVFLGACALSVSLVVLLTVIVPEWRTLPRYVRAGAPSLLLWSFVVTTYAFYALHVSNQQIKRELDRKAFLDEITGAFNFRYLDQRLRDEYERTRRYGGSVAVLFLDLDSFKRVNDRYGHQVGNTVLRGVTQVMQRQIRTCDVLGRAGGDEFIALLPETDRDRAMILAERLRVAVENHVMDLADRQRVDFVRVSVGVAVYPEDGDTMEDVITAADRATYAAKNQGGNRVCSAAESAGDGTLAQAALRAPEGDGT